MTVVKVTLLLQASTVVVRGKVQDRELAASLRLEEWVRPESNGRDPLSMFALVVAG